MRNYELTLRIVSDHDKMLKSNPHNEVQRDEVMPESLLETARDEP